MRRREFITLISSAVASRPLAAFGQRGERVRRIGVLIPFQADPETQALIAGFKQRFKELGWTEGGNVQIDYRFTDGNPERARLASAELVGFTPDVILADANPAVSSLMQVTKSIPIVFTRTSDPVGSGFVSNLAHPGGNITGFHSFEPAIAGKWLEVLKELAPGIRRAAIVHHPSIAANVAFVRAAEAASSAFGVAVAADIEETITRFAQEPNGGLVVAPAPPTFDNRELIVALAARFHLPTVYSYRFFVTSGGLVSYGIDGRDLWRDAAVYVDRILRVAKPGDLPVQLPTKYHLVINLKTAKALGLSVSSQFQQRADEVIE